MSKPTVAVLGIILALAGFALGRYTGSQEEASAPAPAAAPGSSISDVLAEPDPVARVAHLAALLQNLGPEAAPEAREILERPQFDYGVAELELLVRFWAHYEPEAAANWALSTAPEGCPLAAVTPSVEEWATQDPRAAAEALRSMTSMPGPDSQPAELALLHGWFASGQPGLPDYIRDMGISFERQRALGVLASLMYERDGAEALRSWAQGVPDDDKRFKLDVYRQVGAQLAKVDPPAAVEWCNANCEGPYGSNMRALIALHWAARDGEAAMQWLATAPAGKQRDQAVQSAYGAWLRRDRDGAVAWVRAMGVGGVPEWFRPAVGRFVMALQQQDPIAAVEWVQLIPDEEKRELALISIFRHWRYRDEAAAEEWLAQSPLSEEARERARQRAPTELPSLKPAKKSPPS